jgi:virulence-associated protein VagC
MNHAGKTLVDVSRIPMSAMTDVNQTDVHRPVGQFCHADDVWIRNVDSALVLHHYTGRWDQWSFRSDPRLQQQTQYRRTRHRFESHVQASHWIDRSITQSWLVDFVSQVGINQARMLLEGTGRIQAVTMPNNLSTSELDHIYAGLVYPNITNISITRFQ